MKTFRRWTRITLTWVIVLLLGIDTLLWHLDPLGMRRYFDDLVSLSQLAIPAPDGIRYLPGHHQFEMYSASIGLDGLRVVPNSHFSACHIAFIGDSVTFGMGASDSFVNMLASGLAASVSNAGIPGYNVGNIALELETITADGYVWLIIQNDAETTAGYQYPKSLPSATVIYLQYLFPSQSVPIDTTNLFQTADIILSRDDVQAFIFEGERLTELMTTRYPNIIVLPRWTAKVSRYDAHPSSAGHQQIADSMQPYVAEFVNEMCNVTA